MYDSFGFFALVDLDLIGRISLWPFSNEDVNSNSLFIHFSLREKKKKTYLFYLNPFISPMNTSSARHSSNELKANH